MWFGFLWLYFQFDFRRRFHLVFQGDRVGASAVVLVAAAASAGSVFAVLVVALELALRFRCFGCNFLPVDIPVDCNLLDTAQQ